MSEERNMNLEPDERDSVMVYFNPQLIQTLSARSEEKRQNLRDLEAAAEDGDLEAAYQLARDYCYGEEGTPRDEEKGFYWFTKAAEGEHIAAQHGLGLCYARGYGTEKDYGKALALFRSAAGEGYLPSVCELGLCTTRSSKQF